MTDEIQHTTTADIANVKFTLRELIEEVSTLIWEKKYFLEGKVDRGAIGVPEKNLALLCIRRLEVLHQYLLAGGAPPVEEKPDPVVETLPPEPEKPADKPAAVEDPGPNLDDWD